MTSPVFYSYSYPILDGHNDSDLDSASVDVGLSSPVAASTPKSPEFSVFPLPNELRLEIGSYITGWTDFQSYRNMDAINRSLFPPEPQFFDRFEKCVIWVPNVATPPMPSMFALDRVSHSRIVKQPCPVFDKLLEALNFKFVRRKEDMADGDEYVSDLGCWNHARPALGEEHDGTYILSV